MPSTTRADKRPKDPHKYPDADHELTNAEISSLYGSVIAEAIAAFATDPTYAIEMAENANRIEAARARMKASAERKRQAEVDQKRAAYVLRDQVEAV